MGYSKKYAHELLAKPVIQERLDKIDCEMLAVPIKEVVREFVLTEELLDENLAHLIVNGLENGLDGRDCVKAIEIGYRRLGLIK